MLEPVREDWHEGIRNRHGGQRRCRFSAVAIGVCTHPEDAPDEVKVGDMSTERLISAQGQIGDGRRDGVEAPCAPLDPSLRGHDVMRHEGENALDLVPRMVLAHRWRAYPHPTTERPELKGTDLQVTGGPRVACRDADPAEDPERRVPRLTIGPGRDQAADK